MPSRAGSPNKNKERLLSALKKEYGDNFDPILQMADNSYKMQVKLNEMLDSEDPDAMRFIPEVNKEWGRIAEYVTPKLKALEVSGDEESPLKIIAIDYQHA